MAVPEPSSEDDFLVVIEDGNAIISGYTGEAAIVSIPPQIDGYPVVAIRDRAFYAWDRLTAVIIPDGVTAIGAYAFEDCAGLTALTIPESVVSIGDFAFAGCDNLTLLVMEGSYGADYATERALRHAFLADAPKPLTFTSGAYTYTLAEGQATILQGNPDAIELEIPTQLDGYPVAGVAAGAFLDCPNLGYIEAEEGHPVYASVDGVLFDANRRMLAAYPPSRREELYIIPEDTQRIDSHAFSGASNLIVVIVPDSIVSIGEHAFADCGNLILLTSQNAYAAQYAQENALRHALTAADSPLTEDMLTDDFPEVSLITSGEYVYALAQGQAIITQYTGDATDLLIPQQLDGYPVTQIEGGAFAGNQSLIEAYIPQSVTAVNGGAFASCGNLQRINVQRENPVFESVDGVLFDALHQTLVAYPTGRAASAYTVPQGTQSIGPGAFAGCQAIESVAIPDSVALIGSYAFAWCPKLADLTIPSGVTSVGASAFDGCVSLTLTLFQNSYPARYAQENELAYTYAIPPDASAPVAEEPQFFISGAFGCIEKDGQVTILNYIGNETEVIIPGQVERYPVTAIGDRAFSSRPEIRTIAIPDSVISIGEEVFYGSDGLTLLVTEGSFAAHYARENALPHTFGEPGPMPEPEPEQPQRREAQVRTSGVSLYLRSTPNSSGNNVVVSMPNGATVWIESYSDPWAWVVYIDRRGVQYEGYAYTKFLVLQ